VRLAQQVLKALRTLDLSQLSEGGEAQTSLLDIVDVLLRLLPRLPAPLPTDAAASTSAASDPRSVAVDLWKAAAEHVVEQGGEAIMKTDRKSKCLQQLQRLFLVWGGEVGTSEAAGVEAPEAALDIIVSACDLEQAADDAPRLCSARLMWNVLELPGVAQRAGQCGVLDHLATRLLTTPQPEAEVAVEVVHTQVLLAKAAADLVVSSLTTAAGDAAELAVMERLATSLVNVFASSPVLGASCQAFSALIALLQAEQQSRQQVRGQGRSTFIS
jgi:hypothetical protein